MAIQPEAYRGVPAKYNAGVAQSVEQLICNQQVAGSSPIASLTTGGISRAVKGGGL